MMMKIKTTVLRNTLASVLMLTCLAGGMHAAQAAGPATLNYQGFLTDQKSGVPVNASVSVIFKLYDAPTAGNLLFTETQSLGATNGVINAQIGSVTAFPATLAFDKPYWLEVTVGSDTLAPRQAVASSAFTQNSSRLSSSALKNTAVGDVALSMQPTGMANTAVGYAALVGNGSGAGNVAIGSVAMRNNTSGFNNTAVGGQALQDVTTGYGNIGIGPAAGTNLTTGFANIYIGYDLHAATADESNTLRIGSETRRTFIQGIRGVTPAHDAGQPVVIDGYGQLGSVPGIMFTASGLFFDAPTRQVLNLWGAKYGIGVQDNMMYARTASGFGWFQGGVHSDTWNDPGAGGKRLMGLSEAGLRVVGSDPAGANDITLLADGSIRAKVVNTTSDRNAKENFADVDPRAVLAKLAQLPLHTWNYRGDDIKVKHLGPVAQDFSAAFNVGADDKHIATVDADGVALAAIQGLYRLVQEKDAELAQMKAQLTQLKQSVDWMIAHGTGPTQQVMH